MACGGLGFGATCSEVNRWRGTCPTDIASHWHRGSLSLNMRRDCLFIISPLLWQKRERWCEAPSSFKVDGLSLQPSPGGAQSASGSFWCREFVFSRHQTPRFPVSRAVVIATHWLAERERSLSLDVVNISWLSDWGDATAETCDFGLLYSACDISRHLGRAHQLSFYVIGEQFLSPSRKHRGSFVREKHLINLIFYTLVDLCMKTQEKTLLGLFISLGNTNLLDLQLSKLCLDLFFCLFTTCTDLDYRLVAFRPALWC